VAEQEILRQRRVLRDPRERQERVRDHQRPCLAPPRRQGVQAGQVASWVRSLSSRRTASARISSTSRFGGVTRPPSRTSTQPRAVFVVTPSWWAPHTLLHPGHLFYFSDAAGGTRGGRAIRLRTEPGPTRALFSVK